MNIFEQYDERIRRLEDRLDQMQQAANIRIAKVTAVSPVLRVRYSTDQAATVPVTKKNIDVTYAVGDVVLVLVQDGVPIVGGRIG